MKPAITEAWEEKFHKEFDVLIAQIKDRLENEFAKDVKFQFKSVDGAGYSFRVSRDGHDVLHLSILAKTASNNAAFEFYIIQKDNTASISVNKHLHEYTASEMKIAGDMLYNSIVYLLNNPEDFKNIKKM